ncbi:MAG: hypothetical protein RR865_09820 [Clostridia bacterium]
MHFQKDQGTAAKSGQASRRTDAMRSKPKPRDVLPEQQPVTDEEISEQQPAKWKAILGRVVTGFLVVLILAIGYVFLLLGEPEEEAKNAVPVAEEQIHMPMNALEAPGEANVQNLADTFGQPVLSLYGGSLPMSKARVYDTAFSGGYARRVTVSYAFEDGSLVTAESIRPTAAVTLLGGAGYTLRAGTLYALGGVDAARMDNAEQICIFGQSDTAVYAILCPKAHEAELAILLKQTALISPTSTKKE